MFMKSINNVRSNPYDIQLSIEMGSSYIPTKRFQDTASESNNKRYRKIPSQEYVEVEQEEEDQRQTRIGRRAFPADHMRKLNLPCKRVQREKEPEAAATQNHYEEEEIRRVRRRNPNAISEHKGTETKAFEKSSRKYGRRSYNMAAPSFKRSSSIIHLSNSDWARLPNDIVFSILDKLLEPIDHARFGVVRKEWKSHAKQYNCETKPWLRVLTPMLLIPTGSHGSHGLTTMLYSVSERKIYRKIKLPVPSDDTIYCGFGWMAKLRYTNNGRLAITLTNPFRNSNDDIHLPLIPLVWITSVKPSVKIILPTDPTLDRNNYVVLAICGSQLFFIRGGQKLWTCPMYGLYSTATYYEGRVFSVTALGTIELVVSVLCRKSDYGIHVAGLGGERCTQSRLVQTYFVTSTKGDLLVVKRLLERKKKLRFEVFMLVKSMAHNIGDEVFKITEVYNIGDEAIFVGSNQSVCVSASKFPGYQPNSIYYTNDVGHVVVGGRRSEDIGIFNLEDGTITQHCPQQFVEGKVQAIWISPAFPEF
ncbi:hypothetical protein ACLB2K_000585 [Fragaria x ananassa]